MLHSIPSNQPALFPAQVVNEKDGSVVSRRENWGAKPSGFGWFAGGLKERVCEEMGYTPK